MKTSFIFLSLVAVGLLMAFFTASSSGETEAWDASAFWWLSLPALVLAAGVAGYVEPRYFPAWGIALVAGLWVQMLIAKPLGSLWFVGVVFSVGLVGVCTVGAALGAALRRRMSARSDSAPSSDERSAS